MKARTIVKALASFLWLLAGIVFIAIGVELLYQDSLSISISGNSASAQFAIGYSIAGILFLLESAMTFHGKKLALILSVPIAILMAVFVVGQLDQLFEGSVFPPKYLGLYGAMLLASTLTSVVVLWFGKGADRTNA